MICGILFRNILDSNTWDLYWDLFRKILGRFHRKGAILNFSSIKVGTFSFAPFQNMFAIQKIKSHVSICFPHVSGLNPHVWNHQVFVSTCSVASTSIFHLPLLPLPPLPSHKPSLRWSCSDRGTANANSWRRDRRRGFFGFVPMEETVIHLDHNRQEYENQRTHILRLGIHILSMGRYSDKFWQKGTCSRPGPGWTWVSNLTGPAGWLWR